MYWWKAAMGKLHLYQNLSTNTHSVFAQSLIMCQTAGSSLLSINHIEGESRISPAFGRLLWWFHPQGKHGRQRRRRRRKETAASSLCWTNSTPSSNAQGYNLITSAGLHNRVHCCCRCHPSEEVVSTAPSLNKDIKKRWREGFFPQSSTCLKEKKTGGVNSGVLA